MAAAKDRQKMRMIFFSFKVLLAGFLSASDEIPLFKTFPALKEKAPRVEILKEKTAVEEMFALEGELKIPKKKLFVKRDDGSSDLLGGNKARKLEFIIGAAKAAGARELVTFGMLGSNHALATAEAGRRFGFKVKLILGRQPVTEDVRLKLLALHALGAELHFAATKVHLGIEVLKKRFFPEKGSYFIAPGGSDDEGDLGYVNAFLELKDQLGLERLPERIVVPVGSMGTAAGLLVGACVAGVLGKVRIDGVVVSDALFTNSFFLRLQALSLFRSIKSKLSAPERERMRDCDFFSNDAGLNLITSYFDPGYGAARQKVRDAMSLLERSEKIKTEITYSGKALAYLLDDVQKLSFANKPVPTTLFWLTYNAFDLRRVVESGEWKHPTEKWKDLPEEFWEFF